MTLVVVHHHKASATSEDSAQTAVPVNQLLQEAAVYETQGDKLKAKEAYAKIVSDYPDYEKIEEIQQKLGRIKYRYYSFSCPDRPNCSL